jgi:uncharacterized membrane protein (UPF0127 family)
MTNDWNKTIRRMVAWIATLAMILVAVPIAARAPANHNRAGHHAAELRHPLSGLKVIPLRVGSGPTAHGFRVEVAGSFDEQEKGLMFRKMLGPAEGMIFPMSPARPAAFWMKNTVISLDIIFVGPDHRIANVAANAKPYDLTPLYSAGPVIGVLEIPGGRAAQLGIGTGDAVEW